MIIAEYQCNLLYRGQKEAIDDFLPLDSQNWITRDNALQVDWIGLWPSDQTVVKSVSDDLFETPLNQPQLDFENEGGETYLCGNPPYKGSKKREKKLTDELGRVLSPLQKKWKDNDYVAGWFVKAAQYLAVIDAKAAFVTTNSVCQGLQVDLLWPLLYRYGLEIGWAHTSFKWSNLATKNAGVTVVIVGLQKKSNSIKTLYYENEKKVCRVISPYLIESDVISVKPRQLAINLPEMKLGNMPYGKGLILSRYERNEVIRLNPNAEKFIRKFAGGEEILYGKDRYCLWIEDSDLDAALSIPYIYGRIQDVKNQRSESSDEGGRKLAEKAHQFRDRNYSLNHTIAFARTSSENRYYLPIILAKPDWIFSDGTFALYDAPVFNFAILSSSCT